MTIKEAILKSLEDMQKLATHWDILKHIQTYKYYDFKMAKTPEATISAELGSFIRNGDSRVKRLKQGKSYKYYLTSYEDSLNLNVEMEVEEFSEVNWDKGIETYYERDLHLLFSTYLKSKNIYSKTIFHEQSNRNASHQKWIHPDMIGIEFLKLNTDTTKKFINTLDRASTFKLTSYELKKEIRTDYELKESYFQAVSNSSWANYGYLVAFEINSALKDEIERLNQSFGIGVIELKSNPFESEILFSSKYKELDFKTIDKLCYINTDFKKFITDIDEIITASGKNYIRAKKEFELEFCDSTLDGDLEIESYCREKSIPFEDND